MDSVARLLLDYLNDASRDVVHAVLDTQKLPEGFAELGEALVAFVGRVSETSVLAKALSRGELDVPLPLPSNEIAAPLKGLHAALRHLTWQTQQVAKGDYSQRVEFMGDFSQAFNEMTEQLEKQRAKLLDEIEHRQRENMALLQNKSLYEVLVEQMDRCIIVVDAETAERLFTSRQIDAAVADPGGDELLQQWLLEKVEQMRGQADSCTTELQLPKIRGLSYFSASICPMYWYQRKALAIVLTDVSKEREQLIRLQNIANYDSLTQVYSRRYCMQVLNEWLGAGKGFSLCFVDIDDVKYVNDRFGHSEGDRYIIRVADTLREFSKDAIVCRIGGDEFTLLVQNRSQESVKERMELLRARLVGLSAAYRHSISFGSIVVEANSGKTAAELLGAADERMYAYKRRNKKKYHAR